MLDYIRKLDTQDNPNLASFEDLLICLKLLSYGDTSHFYRYIDEIDKRNVNVWNNYSHFLDREDSFFWVNDYETSLENFSLEHNKFMLYCFGEDWYNNAVKYFEANILEDKLQILEQAKKEYEEELLDDEEFEQMIIEEINLEQEQTEEEYEKL